MHKIAVVTGGTGFIGWNLCERLRDRGWTVRAPVRPSSRNPLPEGIDRLGARLERAELAPLLAGASVVFHLAGLTRASSYSEFVRVNAHGAREVAEAAADAGAFMLAISSMAASGPGTAAAPAREDDDPAPVSLYGRSKLAGEQAIADVAGLRWATLRPPGVYGPRDTDFLPLFRACGRGLFPLVGSSDTPYTLVYIGDLVAAMIAVAEAGVARSAAVASEIFFVGHPEIVTAGAMRAALAGVFKRRVRTLRVPRAALWTLSQLGELAGMLGRPALMNRSRYRELTAPGFVCDVSKLERILNWSASTSLRQGFETTVAWYRDHGLL